MCQLFLASSYVLRRRDELEAAGPFDGRRRGADEAQLQVVLHYRRVMRVRGLVAVELNLHSFANWSMENNNKFFHGPEILTQ